MVKLSAIQLCSIPDVEQNLTIIDEQLSTLPTAQEHLVVLPECCLYFGGKDKDQLELAKDAAQSNVMIEGLADLARKYQVYLVAGSIPQLAKSPEQRFENTSFVFSPSGQQLTSYQKMHLFDVDVEDSEKNYRESRYTQPGTNVVAVTLPFANVGLTICYDLRFPELYRQLTIGGADIITVPAAFTKVTGKAHWQALLQARAIENQVYIVAAGQEGTHQNGRETWGHSMIISPWGEIITQLPTGIGTITADYDAALINKVRDNIPVAKHNRFKTELVNDE